MRKNNLTKAGALLLAVTLASAALTGCGSKNDAQKAGAEKNQTAAQPEAAGTQTAETSEEEKEEAAEFRYPVENGGTLTYWMDLNSNVAANYSNMGETPFGKKLQENTGIQIEFQHPAVGQATEQFNLLLADTTLPDLIEYNWLGYSGGPEKAIQDAVIIPLNDVIDQYCPNLKAYLEANPEIDRMIKTDDGTYYCFPFIRGGDKLVTSTGAMIRGDWLEELGLEVPATIDEWHDVLTAFKEKKGAAAPFTYWYANESLTDNNPFAYAYGAPRGLYLAKDGRIHYGAVEEGYKEYLMTMNQWMSEGLIDVDLATLTNDQVAAKITNGSAGASFGWCGSGMGNWTTAGQATDENYMLVPAPYPTLQKGEVPEFGQKDNNYVKGGAVAITTSCENVELAARLLDYGYSEEGTMLYNFGIEGESYTLDADGNANYTDLILNNPDGLSITHAMGGYMRANYNGPFVQNERYAEQYYQFDSQKDAMDVWSNTNMKDHLIPPITPTVEESKEQAQYMTEINTYRNEMTLKFILGNASFDEWDKYVETIQGMNLDRVLEIQNAALERYHSR